ncbi:hypothetical protein [Nocardioides sp. SR21]|uniref:phage major capsid protein n=1 Tax=Nocardioides sp. SR21 TaxID=2919501 RepID=UPI001FAAC900|nr:hypothetical protein [Nocardioides sp. SR21]
MTTYPTNPTLSGQKITVDWLMNNPVVIYRTLRGLVEQRLIGDKLLAGRVDLTGSGSAVFAVSEGIFANRSAERVVGTGEYPLTDDDPGIPALAVTDKWGLATEIPQDLIAHNRMDVVRRKLVKLANRIAFGFDALVLSAIATAVTQEQQQGAAWSAAGADPFLDLMLGGAKVDENNQGYDVNVVALTPTEFARAVAAAKVIERMPREGSSTLVITGRMIQIAGLTFLKTTNMPSGVKRLVVDSTQLGSIATERLGGTGWTGGPDDVETNVEPLQGRDGFLIRARKVAVPMVQEPNAAVEITDAA